MNPNDPESRPGLAQGRKRGILDGWWLWRWREAAFPSDNRRTSRARKDPEAKMDARRSRRSPPIGSGCEGLPATRTRLWTHRRAEERMTGDPEDEGGDPMSPGPGSCSCRHPTALSSPEEKVGIATHVHVDGKHQRSPGTAWMAWGQAGVGAEAGGGCHPGAPRPKPCRGD